MSYDLAVWEGQRPAGDEAGTKFYIVQIIPQLEGYGNHRPTSPKALVGGTVTVDSSGQVRELTTNAPLEEQVKIGAKTITYYTSYDMTFSDFGTRVTVTAPSASQVYDAGNVYGTNPFGIGY